jgi:hypothetical protein
MLLLNEFDQAMGQVISEYERGKHEPNRSMEIAACLIMEFKDQYSELYEQQINEIDEVSAVITDWETARIEPADAIERICAIHRTWVVK